MSHKLRTLIISLLLITSTAVAVFPMKVFAQNAAGTTPPAENSYWDICGTGMNPFGGGSPSGCVVAFIGTIVYAITYVFGVLAMLASFALDLAIKFAVFDIAKYIGEESVLIDVWKIGRDFCNVFFLFILLYIGIGTMLRLDIGDWQKKVIAVLISALLINFSLPLTRAAVDVSNIVSLQFYTKISKNAATAKGTTSEGFFAGLKADPTGTIAWPIMQKMENTRAERIQKYDPKDGLGRTSGDIILSGIFSILVLLVTTFVLLFGAGIVLARGLALIFLVLLSAFPAILYHFKKTKPYFTKYMETFGNQLFFLPAYLFMLYFSLRIVLAVTDAVGGKADSMVNNAIAYAIAIGAMGMSVIVATELGAAGAKWASGMAAAATGAGVGGVGMAFAPVRNAASALGRGVDKLSGGNISRVGRGLDNLSGNRISAVARGITSNAESTLNKGFSLATAGAVGGFMSTSADREKASNERIAAAAAAADKPKKETEQKVTNIQNQWKALGLNTKDEKGRNALATALSKLDGDTRKAVYAKMEAKDKAAIDAFLAPDVKDSLGKERMPLLKGRAQDQAAILNKLKDKPADLVEIYEKLGESEKIAIESYLDGDAKTALERTSPGSRLAVIADEYAGNPTRLLAYLRDDLNGNEGQQMEFFRKLDAADQGRILQMLPPGPGTPGTETLGDRLRSRLSEQKQRQVASAGETAQHIETLRNPVNPAAIRIALDALDPDDLKREAPLLRQQAVFEQMNVRDLRKIVKAKIGVQTKTPITAWMLANRPPGTLEGDYVRNDDKWNDRD